jgi:hypothetical protein
LLFRQPVLFTFCKFFKKIFNFELVYNKYPGEWDNPITKQLIAWYLLILHCQ